MMVAKDLGTKDPGKLDDAKVAARAVVAASFDVGAKRESRTRSSQIAFLMRRWMEEQKP